MPPRRFTLLPPALRRPFADEWFGLVVLLLLPCALYLAPLAAAWLVPLLTASVLWQARAEGALAVGAIIGEAWPWYALVVVMAASALWAIDPPAALWLAARLALLIACGSLLAGTLRRLPVLVVEDLLAALGWGMLAAGLLVAVDLAAGTPALRLLHGAGSLVPAADAYSRGAVFQGLAAAPLAIGLWRCGRRRLAAAQFVAVALAVGLGLQDAAKLALLAGLGGGFLVVAVPAARYLVPVVIVAGSIALPWILPVEPSRADTCWLAEAKPSGLHRLLIWNWVDARVRERPVLGWGLDAARRMAGGTEHVVIRRCVDHSEGDGPVVLDNEILPLHPHNAALQIWLELGGVGIAAAGLALLGGAAVASRRLPGRQAAAPVAALTAAASVAALSFGIWQEWWVAVLALSTVIGLAAGRLAAPPVRTP